MNIYVTKNGQRLGPYSLKETQDLVNAGTFQTTDWAWHEGISMWMPLHKIAGFAPVASLGGTPPLLWFIALYYAGRALFALYSWAHFFLLFSNSALSARYLLPFGFTVLIILIDLLAVVLLLLLRKESLYCFGGAFAASLLFMAYNLIAFHWLSSTAILPLLNLLISCAINISVLVYIWRLTQKGVLR